MMEQPLAVALATDHEVTAATDEPHFDFQRIGVVGPGNTVADHRVIVVDSRLDFND